MRREYTQIPVHEGTHLSNIHLDAVSVYVTPTLFSTRPNEGANKKVQPRRHSKTLYCRVKPKNADNKPSLLLGAAGGREGGGQGLRKGGQPGKGQAGR